jgi:tRNA-binding protein
MAGGATRPPDAERVVAGIPLGRTAEAEDVGAAVSFLASERRLNGDMTGHSPLLHPKPDQRNHVAQTEETDYMIEFRDFQKLDIRVGEIVRAEEFPEARKPAYKLWIDCGPEIGVKRSSAQLPANYSLGQLPGTRVMCVVNLPARRIGPMVSEVLTLGVPDLEGECVLVVPGKDVPVGGRLY